MKQSKIIRWSKTRKALVAKLIDAVKANRLNRAETLVKRLNTECLERLGLIKP